MDLANINKVYFVGVGGIGMSALARYFVKKGCRVFGYDKTKTPLTTCLAQEGISISYKDEVTEIPNLFAQPASDLLVVNTPSIPKDNQILNFFKNGGFALKKRSEVLGIISKEMFCIAVAGTHGKTTTSAMIAHLLKATGFDCTAFWGISGNYNSNVLYGQNNVVVVEADEYDRSFLTLRPDVAVITSMDADHLDIYGNENRLKESFALFASQLKKDGRLFVKDGLNLPGITYGLETSSAIKAKNIRLQDGCFLFDFQDGCISLKDIRLPMPGRHNLENATVAVGVALSLGIHPQSIKKAMAGFKGVKRRFEIIVKNKAHIYIDDYAHHPQELKACFNAVREFYPDKKLTVIFQPHLFTRTKDFADEFAAVLSAADEIILLEIYPARELPIERVNARMLLNKINCSNKQLCTKPQALEWVRDEKPELILTVGAGDIDNLVQPLKTILEK